MFAAVIQFQQSVGSSATAVSSGCLWQGRSLFLDDLLKHDFLALICSLIKFTTAPGQNAVWDFYSKPSGFKLSIKYLLVDWASGKILFLDDITNG